MAIGYDPRLESSKLQPLSHHMSRYGNSRSASPSPRSLTAVPELKDSSTEETKEEHRAFFGTDSDNNASSRNSPKDRPSRQQLVSHNKSIVLKFSVLGSLICDL